MKLLDQAGRFAATVRAAEFGEASTGTPFLRIDFDTAEPESSISGWLYLSENAFENTLQTLRNVFGFDGDFDSAPKQITGKKCSIVTEIESDKGKERIRVKWINTVSTAKPLGDRETFLKNLTAKASRIPAKTKAAPSKPAPKAKDSDEDVPF